MDNNPYLSVGAPNYAAPLVNLFGGQFGQSRGNPMQPQQPQMGGQMGAQPQPGGGQPGVPPGLAMLQQRGQQSPGFLQQIMARFFPQQGQQGSYQPRGPMNLNALGAGGYGSGNPMFPGPAQPPQFNQNNANGLY